MLATLAIVNLVIFSYMMGDNNAVLEQNKAEQVQIEQSLTVTEKVDVS